MAGKAKGGPRPSRKSQTVTEKKPRQARLPQMDDAKIEGLQAKAEQYFDLKDTNMRANVKQKNLKKELLEVMKAEAKTHYHYQGITVQLTKERENVVVTRDKPKKSKG